MCTLAPPTHRSVHHLGYTGWVYGRVYMPGGYWGGVYMPGTPSYMPVSCRFHAVSLPVLACPCLSLPLPALPVPARPCTSLPVPVPSRPRPRPVTSPSPVSCLLSPVTGVITGVLLVSCRFHAGFMLFTLFHAFYSFLLFSSLP